MPTNSFTPNPIDLASAARRLSPEELAVERQFQGTRSSLSLDDVSDEALGREALAAFNTGPKPGVTFRAGVDAIRRAGASGSAGFRFDGFNPSDQIRGMFEAPTNDPVTGRRLGRGEIRNFRPDFAAIGAAVRAENPTVFSFERPTNKNSRSRITRFRIRATDFGDQRRAIRQAAGAVRTAFQGLDPQRALPGGPPPNFGAQRRGARSLLGINGSQGILS